MKQDIALFNFGNAVYLKKINSKIQISEKDDSDGYLIDANGDEKQARSIIESLKRKNKILAVVAYDNNFNRRMLETTKINYFVFSENAWKKDSLKQRDSGINHVTAKIAKEKNICFVINFLEITKFNPEQKAKAISRIIQNLKICRKAKCDIKIASFAKSENEIVAPRTMKDFLSSLGASTEQIAKSIIYN